MADVDDDDAILAKPVAPRGRGRPRVITPGEATTKAFAALGRLMCTNEEVAGWFACAEQTLLNHWEQFPEDREAFDDGKRQGRISLRRKQHRLAEKNAAMAIFLGMNELEQEDRRGMRLEANPIKHEPAPATTESAAAPAIADGRVLTITEYRELPVGELQKRLSNALSPHRKH